MRKLSIKSVERFREFNEMNSGDTISFRGEPIFIRDGSPLTGSIFFRMTNEEVVNCVKAEYEEPNPLKVEVNFMDQEVHNAINQLREAGVDVHIMGVKLNK